MADEHYRYTVTEKNGNAISTTVEYKPSNIEV